jgi:hypothetical protein
MVVGLPKPDESLAFELAAEERTDAGPGQAKRGVGLAIVAEQKGIAQRLADRAGVDIGALGAPCARRADRANERIFPGSKRVSSPSLSHFSIAGASSSQVGTARRRHRLSDGR